MNARDVIADVLFYVVGDATVGDLKPEDFYVDRLLGDLDEAGFDIIERDGPHYIDVTEDGWSIQHPAKCRPDLLGCLHHRCIEEHVREYGEVMVDELGRYTFGVDDDGEPSFTRSTEPARDGEKV